MSTLAISFASPIRLWLLVAALGLLAAYVVLQAAKHKYAVRFTNLALLDKVAPRQPGWRRHVVAATFLGAIALQVVAFANPQRTERIPKERATVVLAIDVSLSMAAEDVAPNRLEGAKEAAKQFVEELPPKLNLGIVAFSGIAAVQVAPTQDREAALRAIDELELGEGTAIGDAILASLSAIDTVPADDEGTTPPAVIILMSDGKTTKGTLDADAAAEANAAGVAVSTIAFGTAAGTITLPEEPVPIPVPVDEAALAAVADATGGDSYDAESTEELKQVYQGIGSSIGYVEERHSVAGWFVGLALLAALVTGVLSLTWFSRLP
jgi:Ca-activated chloride channel family protein